MRYLCSICKTFLTVEEYSKHSCSNPGHIQLTTTGSPLLYGKVFGWRAFHADLATGQLYSPMSSSLIAPVKIVQVTEAECKRPNYLMYGETHHVPDFDCSCGFYSYFTFDAFYRNRAQYHAGPRYATTYSPQPWRKVGERIMVIALISVSGKVVLHDLGMRAQRIHLETIFADKNLAVIKKKYPQVKVHRMSKIRYINLPNKSTSQNLDGLVIPKSEVSEEEYQKWTLRDRED